MGAIKKLVKSAAKTITGFDSDAIAAASQAQADATSKTAADQATALREQAVQAQRSQETLAAQRQAADQAAALLNTGPVEQADVSIATAADNIDPTSGKRVRPRDAYSASKSGISI